MNNPFEWWLDEFVRQWIIMYYWPYWLAGNMDNIVEGAGITLNGICPPNARQAKQFK